ncbi:MAG TPA: hypothetical protein VK177_03305 [Flavobacteriales bacterium]|nr:hypothetical protein [Flavobacteriales bacterium]
MKHFFAAMLTLVSLGTFCQNLKGKYKGNSKLRNYYFEFKEGSRFEYNSTGFVNYKGKGNYAIKGNKITFTFFYPEDTTYLTPVKKECGSSSGNVMNMIVRDPKTGMFLACDYEVFDASGKTIQPRKAFLHCLFLNTSALPDGAYLKLYHDERKTVLLKVDKNGCNEYHVPMVYKDRDEKIENGHVWEFNFFVSGKGFILSEAGQNYVTEGITLSTLGWTGEFVKE